MVLAVDVNVVVEEPAGTVTLRPGTGSRELFVESDTTVPPLGLGPLKVIVQVVVPDVVRLVGMQDKEESVGTEAGPVTMPPDPDVDNA